MPHVIPVCGTNHLMFWQAGATTPTAKDAVQLSITVNIQFLRPHGWPPDIPDVNLLDNSLCTIIDEAIDKNTIPNFEHLKCKIKEV